MAGECEEIEGSSKDGGGGSTKKRNYSESIYRVLERGKRCRAISINKDQNQRERDWGVDTGPADRQAKGE